MFSFIPGFETRGFPVYFDSIKIVGWDVTFGFNVDGHLTDNELVHALKGWNFNACATNQNARCLPNTGDDVRHIGRCLNVSGCQDENNRDKGIPMMGGSAKVRILSMVYAPF